MALLIPKLRSHFAEFLNHRSPERLRLLASPTCVSFSTVNCIVPCVLFLAPPPQTSPTKRARDNGLRRKPPPHLAGGSASEDYTRGLNLRSRCRNINLPSIVYAFRPRLRDRLTLGGFTFPRKP